MKKQSLLIAALLILINLLGHAQIITTVAGTGTEGYNGDNITATSAQLFGPISVALDDLGNIYIADIFNNRIRKVDAISGIITTIAGTGTMGYNGDNIAATSAQLFYPGGVAFDASSNLYISDYYNERIRKVDAITGIITTIAGTGTAGYNGDNIAATSAQLDGPCKVAFDVSGNIYISDYYNERIRKVDAITGIITTIAGTGTAGYNGDNIAATSAQLNGPWGVAIDASGNVYFGDTYNERVRKINVSTGIITTIAGTGTEGYNGDNILATSAQLNNPQGITLDTSGNIYIGDLHNYRIRKIDANNGIITTIAGTGTSGYNGDNIAATSAQLSDPFGVAIDSLGNIYITDRGNNRIRKIIPFKITSQPVSANVCPLNAATFSVSASSVITYKWQVNTGAGFVNVVDTGMYSGSGTSSLHITGVTNAMNGYAYQCVLTSGSTLLTNPVVLTVNPTYNYQINQTICQGDSVLVGTHIYNTSGSYTDSLFTSSTCDSIIITNLTVNPLPPTPVITQNGNSLTSSATTGNQWYNSATGAITNATLPTYMPTHIGDYYTIVTISACSSDTSNHIYFDDSGIEVNGNNNVNPLRVYPNPAKDNLTLETNSYKEQNLEIINLMGQSVYTSIIKKQASITIAAFPWGLYLIKLSNDKGTVVRRFMKE